MTWNLSLKPVSRWVVALLAYSLFCLAPAQADRQNLDWNSGWKFLNSEAEPTASTELWTSVPIPHTWNVDNYRRGAGWYAKSFSAPTAWRKGRVFIFFEAVSISSDVYLNGEKLGRHEGAFTAFCYELTPFLKYGQTNEIRVRADNSNQGIAPISADFNFNGGIYRPVHLIVSDKVLISPLDHASSGLYLTQRQVSAQSASVEIKTLVSNGDDKANTLKIETEIFDGAGQRVSRSLTNLSVGAGTTVPAIQMLSLERPRLWNALKDPYLYSVKVRVTGRGQSDEMSQPLGLRNIGFTADERFLLNGAPYPIRGVNRHQDLKGKAWALNNADHATDVALIKEMGATAIRLAHYPQSHVFLDLCDRNGLLLWEEIPIVNRVLETAKFSENARQQLTEMILQGYNHPSIMVWGLFNEVTQPKDTHPDQLIGELRALATTLDASRPTVGATDTTQLKLLNGAPEHIGFNMYPGWYFALPGDYSNEILKRSQSMNGRRIALSEYGGGASVIQHQEGLLTKPGASSKFHPEEWQTFLHQSALASFKDNPHLWGTFIWAMFDFAVAGRNEGDRPGINDKGLITDDRKTRKDAYFFYKANWNPEPMVSIAARRMTPRQLASTQVKVFSNGGEVELFVNGKSLGSAKPDSVNVFRWEKVELAPGNNHIEAKAKFNGRLLSDHCDWVLQVP